MLAGMIAEPAFLSEYTIFALDHSKRPKTAQVASVVSCSHSLLPPTSSYLPVLLLHLLSSFLASLCLWKVGRRLAHVDPVRAVCTLRSFNPRFLWTILSNLKAQP